MGEAVLPLELAEPGVLIIFWLLVRPKIAKKKAVIKLAASTASPWGGCASSRLDLGLKFYVIWGGCASSRLIHEFSDSELSRSDPQT